MRIADSKEFLLKLPIGGATHDWHPIHVLSDRPKDRDDVILIGAKCTYEAVLDRAKRMFAWYVDRSAFPGFVERLARCMARDFHIRLDAVDRDFALPPVVSGKVVEIRSALEAQFLSVLTRY